MANRKDDKIDKSGRGQCSSTSGISKHNGVHSVAAEYKKNDKCSALEAYRKAIKFCQSTMDEIKTIALSQKFEVAQLT
jgi:hypothetical protein